MHFDAANDLEIIVFCFFDLVRYIEVIVWLYTFFIQTNEILK